MRHPKVTTVEFFNWWRKNYNNISPDENTELYNEIELAYPKQVHFTAKHYQDAIDECPLSNLFILEIGGWKGELASCTIPERRDKITKWQNIETCLNAVTKPNFKDPKYLAVFKKELDWFKKETFTGWNMLFSSNTIEHISDDHFIALLEKICKIPIIVFEAPLEEHENNWTDYNGTHILKMGWKPINFFMMAKGYEVIKLSDQAYKYKLK